jgi:hypothetical protein
MSEPSPAARPKLNTTSSAVNGVPSWKRTLRRRSKRHTVGAVWAHLVASAGSSPSLRSRPTSGSYTLPVIDSCSDSFSECGSSEVASP